MLKNSCAKRKKKRCLKFVKKKKSNRKLKEKPSYIKPNRR